MKKMIKMKALAAAIAFAGGTLVCLPVYASDTEVYVQSTAASPNSAPTLMMVLDTSGSMNWCMDRDLRRATDHCPDGDDRVEVMSKAMDIILFGDGKEIKAAPGYVKMGFARFIPDANKGGWVRYPARPLDAFVAINPDGSVSSKIAAGTADAIETASGTVSTTGTELLVGGSADSSAGLLFDAVKVPQGATVQDAYIELTAKNDDASVSDWVVSVEDSAAPAVYGGINSRAYGVSTTHHAEPWVSGSSYRIPVTGLVQDRVNRVDWCGGDNLAFRLQDAGLIKGTRRAYSFEGASTTTSRIPRLVVTFLSDPKDKDSCIIQSRASFSAQVQSTIDDVTWSGSSAPVAVQDYLKPNFVSNSNVRDEVAVRFSGMNLPKNVTIDRAELIGKVAAAITVKPMTVAPYATDNFGAMCTSTTTTVKGKPVTTISCNRPTTALDTAITAPATATNYAAGALLRMDVKSAVQALVNRSGWANGNAIGFNLKNASTSKTETGDLQFYDYSKDALSAFTLEIDWTERVKDLSTFTTVRADLANELTPAKLNVDGGTPLGSAYGEASLYMYGKQTTHTNTSELAYVDPRTVNGTTYISPLSEDNKCGANYIFMLSDGDPNDLANVNSITSGLTGQSCVGEKDDVVGNGKALNWTCMFTLAKYNYSDKVGSVSKPVVRTSTVMFGPKLGDASANMKTLAEDKGGGRYYEATDVKSLVAALTDTLKALVSAGNTISAPGVAVNQMNRLTHLDQLYYAVFDPEPGKIRWDGNLKRYKLDLGNSQILDRDAVNAVDTNTGFFKSTSRSFWSSTTDGDRAVDGGAAEMLDAKNRVQYTYTDSLASTDQPLIPVSSLSGSTGRALLGVSTDTALTNLLNWYKGYVVPNLTDAYAISDTSPQRDRMGAGLHSRPSLVNFGYGSGDSTNPDSQFNYIFFSTTEGTLHAIEAKTGVEKFSFIPGEKLPVLKSLFDAGTGTLPEFGMDLSWTVYRKDTNFDNQINSSGADKVYIYGGMRMGGDNYYALDVTGIHTGAAPRLLFAIDGGSNDQDGRFKRMGQTWSQPVLATMKIGTAVTTVLVFGGGYHNRHEDAGDLFTGNDLGNQLYIVDAVTGKVYWSASGNSEDNPSIVVPEMKFSVPSAPKVLDVNGDGLADTVYFGDLGGQMFRADFVNGNTGSNLAKRVRLIAKLGQTVTANVENQRRFYEPPTVALFDDVDDINSGRPFAAVAFGSGYRSHPLDQSTNDRFYTLFDFDVTRFDLRSINQDDSSLKSVITESDLSLLDPASTAGAAKDKMGWYIKLPSGGEKSMASGLIFNNQLVFTSYVPTLEGISSCTPVIGRTKLYRQCMPYGGIGDTCSWEGDRVQDNVMMGISGEPQYIFQNTTTAAGATVLKGGLILGAAPPIPLGEYKVSVQRMHRFREKRN